VLFAIAIIGYALYWSSSSYKQENDNVAPPVSTFQPIATATPQLPVGLKLETDVNKTAELLNSGKAVYLYSLVNEPHEPEMYEPGNVKYTVTLNQQKIVFLNIGWCAISESVRKDNLSHAYGEVAIDGYVIPDNQLQEYDYEIATGKNPEYPQGLFCSEFGVLVSEWPLGEYSVLEEYGFTQQINDGYHSYDTGTYITEYDVTVH